MTIYLLHGYLREGDGAPQLTVESKNGPFFTMQDRVYSMDHRGEQVTWLVWHPDIRKWVMDANLLGFKNVEDPTMELEWFSISASPEITVPVNLAIQLDMIDARLSTLLNYIDDKRRAEAEGVAKALRSEIDMETATDDLLAMYEREITPLAR